MRKLLSGGAALLIVGGAALADDADVTCYGGETYRAADGTLRRTARVCKEMRTITVEPEKKVPDWVCGDAFDERGRKVGRTCHKARSREALERQEVEQADKNPSKLLTRLEVGKMVLI